MIDYVTCLKSRNAKKACELMNAKSWLKYVSSLCRSHSFLSRIMLIIRNMNLGGKSSRLSLWSCRVVYKQKKTRTKVKRRLCDDEDIWLCWISRYQQIRNQHRVQIVFLLTYQINIIIVFLYNFLNEIIYVNQSNDFIKDLTLICMFRKVLYKIC